MSFSSRILCEHINYVMLSGSKTPVLFYSACKGTAWSKTGKGIVKPELNSGGDLIHRCINYSMMMDFTVHNLYIQGFILKADSLQL